jgi:acyl-CoA thioesterase-1
MPRGRLALTALLALVLGACGRQAGPPAEQNAAFGDEAAKAPDGRPAAPAIGIAFLGDSLTAGLGLPSEEAYPAVIEQAFHAEGYSEVEVVNGGVSGDTTAGGLRRVEQYLGADTKLLVVALGGNDALRGLTAAQTHDNLAAIIDQAVASGVGIVLAGMLAPTNLGEDYQKSFREAFARLAREYRDSIVYIPFLLEGVAGDPALNQADGIHPNAKGARVIAEQLYPYLRRLVDDELNGTR